jgi:UDP-3-O-[3-hydroxymyristoyl] N-acetylglucosamine deacetylase
VNRLSYRYQRTLAQPAEVCGAGLLTGAAIHLRFLPAPPATGLVFVRTDLRPPVFVPAQVGLVTGTQRRTTLGQAPAQIALVEHVLASLAGMRIDNCYIELDAVEPPGLDGSARGFVEALQAAGIVLQTARRATWTVDAPVVVSSGGATLALHPSAEPRLRISYLLDYGLGSPISKQSHTAVLTPASFAADLADARTFVLECEALELRRQGIGTRTTAADLLVIGPHGPIDNKLRYADELARHKVLDIVGDLALFGHDLCGHVVAYRSGHPLNVELVRQLSERLARRGRSAPKQAA